MERKDLTINPHAHPEIQFVTTSPDHLSEVINWEIDQEVKMKEGAHLRKPSDFISEEQQFPMNRYFSTELPSHSRILDIRNIFVSCCREL